MRKFTVGCLAVVGTIAILFFLLLLVIVFAASSYKGRVPSSAVLEVNLESGVIEDIPDEPVAKAMLSGQPSMRDIVDAIERASTDDRVKGLFARFGGSTMGLAKTQEIREEGRAFRAHKKFAVAWSESFGEFGPGGSSYYLASAF